jgi:hypothetical protein
LRFCVCSLKCAAFEHPQGQMKKFVVYADRNKLKRKITIEIRAINIMKKLHKVIVINGKQTEV